MVYLLKQFLFTLPPPYYAPPSVKQGILSYPCPSVPPVLLSFRNMLSATPPKLSIGLLWNLAELCLRMGICALAILIRDFFHWGGFWGKIPPKTISLIYTYRGPLSATPKLSLRFVWNLAGLFLGMCICALAILIWDFFHFGEIFWGKSPPTIFWYTYHIRVPYPQPLNYPLDNSETWLDCSLGCVYVHKLFLFGNFFILGGNFFHIHI